MKDMNIDMWYCTALVGAGGVNDDTAGVGDGA